MTWATWTGEAATGQGLLWLNLCQPNCAAGKIARYPVQVTLSDVQTSAHRRWFGNLAITWESAKPRTLPLSSYSLMSPS